MDPFAIDLDAALDQLEAEMAESNQQTTQSVLSSPGHSALKLAQPASNGDCYGQSSHTTYAQPVSHNLEICFPSAPVSAPMESAPVSAPVESAPVSDPVESAPVSAPAYSAPVSPPASSAPVSAPAYSAPVSAPAYSSPVSAPAYSAPVSAPAYSAPVIAPVDSAPVSAPAYSAPVSAPVDSAPVSAAAYSAPVSAPVESAPVSAPAYSAPVSAPVESAPVSAAAYSAPVSAPVDSAPVSASAYSAPVSAPVDSAPVSASAYSSPVSAPVESAPVSAPAYSAPVSAPVESAPVSAPAYSAPVSAPVESAPVIDPVESAPASDLVESAPASDLVESAPASDPVESAPASDLLESAPASDPVESAPVSAPAYSAPVSAPAYSAPVSAPAYSAPVSAPAYSVSVSAPVESAPVSPPAYSASVSAPVESAPVSAPAYSASVSAPVESAPVSPPAYSAQDSDPVESAPVSAPVDSATVSPPAYSAQDSDPVESAPVSDPVDSAPVFAPAYSSLVSAPVESARVNVSSFTHPDAKQVNAPAGDANGESAPIASFLPAPINSCEPTGSLAGANFNSLAGTGEPGLSSIRFADLAQSLPELTEADLELLLEEEAPPPPSPLAQPSQEALPDYESSWSLQRRMDSEAACTNKDYGQRQEEQPSSLNPMYGLVGGVGCLATEATSAAADYTERSAVGGDLNPMYGLQEEWQQPASLGATGSGGGATSPPSPPPTPQQLMDADLEADADTEPPHNDEFEANESEAREAEAQPLGTVKPAWIPDSEAPVCMQCESRFTVLRRRHHCRACGRVFCAACAAYTARLAFLDDAKARVCAVCYQELIRLESNPEARLTSQQPPVSALKSGRSQVVRSRSVVFSDGIRPGGDLLEDESLAGAAAAAATSRPQLVSSTAPESSLEPSLLPANWSGYPPHEPLPAEEANNSTAAMTPEAALRGGKSVIYQVTLNVTVECRLVSLPCCGHPSVWLLATRGLDSVGQTDLLLLLSRRPPAIDGSSESILPPLHLLHLVYAVYERAYNGTWARHLSFVGWHASQPLLGDRGNAGWLFFRPSRLHCLLNLGLEADFVCRKLLCGLLVLRWEAPWAELFPQRLLLRLGSESRLYPSPLVSVRDRAPVYGELGRSLIGLLADFRNFTYTLPAPPGLRVHLRAGCTSVLCPTASYAAVQKALAQCQPDAKVLAFGAEFSPTADAHLVCHQNMETGDYAAQAISVDSRGQLGTTAGLFVVFNAGGFSASRASIVEDGVMVQLTDAQLAQLFDSLKAMRNWSAVCQQPQQQQQPAAPIPDGGELIEFRWLDDDETDCSIDEADFSPIDGAPLTGAGRQAMPIAAGQLARNQQSGHRRIRWTLASLLQDADQADGTPADSLRIAGRLAGAVCQALDASAPELLAYGQRLLAVRARLGPDSLHYEAAASGGAALLAEGAAEQLDRALVPALSELSRDLRSELALELRFVCLYA